MKRPLQLPLAIALALSGTDAFALGLGTIHVNSKLNQPLDAEIPVLQGTQGEAEGLLVQLASAEDFDRVGLNRGRISVPLEFSLVKGSHGDMVIKVTSKDVVREPFLDFLVEANWPKGRLLREYTVLLDPPIMAPATGTTAVTSATKAPERAPTQPLPEAKPKPALPARPVASAPRATAPSKPAPAPATPAPAPRHAASGNEYTVEAGDTLSGIAREVRPDESASINQLMLALLKQNPNAFYKDNINALKRGAILRIPSADQVKAVGSASEAAAQVHQQIEDWRGAATTKPTLVADTGAKPEPKAATAAKTPSSTSGTTAATPKSGERLELVPPKAGKDTVAMADRPGSGAGGASSSGELRSELARTKEALTSRDQEATELKSRVKELEDTKGKSDRLIAIQQSQIADLQAKLKSLQEQEAKPATKPGGTTPATAAGTAASTASTSATTPPSATSPTSTTTPSSTAGAPAGATAPAGKVSKEDIWGTASSTTPEGKTPATSATSSTTPATPSGNATTSATTPSTSTSTPASTSATTPPSTSATGASTTSATGTTGSTTPSSAPSSSSTMPTSTPSATPSGTTTATTTPAAKPETSTAAVKPTTKPAANVMARTPGEPEWYEQAWVKPAAIGAAALLLLAGLVSMRKRKAAVPARGSIAGAFGDSPIRDSADAMSISSAESEELALRDQLAHEPGNLGLHLELLSLLYAERSTGAFEDAAEMMHTHVVDPHQPEWLEVKAMGQELAPHNPLFSDGAEIHDAFDDEAVTAPHATPMFDHDEVFKPRETAQTDDAFDFGLSGDELPSAPATPVVPESETAFDFDHLPPVDYGHEAQHEMEAAVAPPPPQIEEEEFAAEDGVGTKLDLAKAYLDMGDPEGARSMLEEVLAEGNDVQKGEAQRLMAEIR